MRSAGPTAPGMGRPSRSHCSVISPRPAARAVMCSGPPSPSCVSLLHYRKIDINYSRSSNLAVYFRVGMRGEVQCASPSCVSLPKSGSNIVKWSSW